MTETLVDQLNRRREALRTERTGYISDWRDCAELIRPRGARFLVTDRNRNSKKASRIIDPTATFASRTLSSGMMAGVTSPARPWLALRTADPDLNKWQPVKCWLEDRRNQMLEIFLKSNLYTVLPGTYADLGDFGVHAFSLLRDELDVIRAYPAPIGSYMLAVSHRGVVDTFYREYSMTAAQLVRKFGKENVSAQVLNAYQGGKGQDQWFNVVHVIEPNPEADGSKLLSKFKAWRSIYYEVNGKDDKVLQERGFDSFPVMAPRWNVIGEDIYGSDCPAMDALGTIKGLQQSQKRKYEGIDKITRPPMTAPSSLRNGAASQLAGGITFVDVVSGQQGFQPAFTVPPTFLQPLAADIQDVREIIKRAYYEDLFLLISQIDRTGVTAEEIASKKEEKLLMLGPAYLRLNDELLTPVVDRTWDIMQADGHFPPPPPELLRDGGLDLTVEFTSVMAEAMKLSGIGGIERGLQLAARVAQLAPEALDNIDPDATITEAWDKLSAPPRMLRDPKVRDQVRAQRTQMQQGQQALAAGQQAAQTVQTLGQTPVTDPSVLTQLVNQMQGA